MQIKHMKTVMPVFKETNRQISNNKDFCTCSTELEQVRSLLSGREGEREAAGQFFSCGRRALPTWPLPSAFSPAQAQQPPEGLKGSRSGAPEEQPQQGQNWAL